MISNPYNSNSICFQSCNSWEDYTIKEKDTLYNISVRFGVPVRMLMACNHLVNPYNLQLGQVIKVPSARPEASGCDPESEISYVVQLRDTLYSIAEQNDSTVEDIIRRNPGLDPYNLKPGTRLCVPKEKKLSENSSNNMSNLPQSTNNSESMNSSESMNNSASTNMGGVISAPIIEENTNSSSASNAQCPGNTYIVKSGDSLEMLLNAFDVTYATMAFFNPTTDLYNLTEGTVLCVPVNDMFRTCNSGTTYVIRNGDSLETLSNRFNVSQTEIVAANPFMRPSDFSAAGAKICIPE